MTYSEKFPINLRLIKVKTSFKNVITEEILLNEKIERYLKITLKLTELMKLEGFGFLNWFDFNEKQTLTANDIPGSFFNIGESSYFKIYSVYDIDKKENFFFNIAKQDYVDGLCYKVKKIYPRPEFTSSMYKVHFVRLDFIKKDIIKEINKTGVNIEENSTTFKYKVLDESLLISIRFS